MGDLDLLLAFGRHVPIRFIRILRCLVDQITMNKHALGGALQQKRGAAACQWRISFATLQPCNPYESK
jgi:hypothetical protein